MLHILLSGQKKGLLEKYGWYRNRNGGYTDPHAKDCMTRFEIAAMTLLQLEYALKHGSQAVYPEL